MGIIYNKITHLVLRARHIEHILFNLNTSLRSKKCKKKYITCDSSVNRELSDFKTPL